MAQIIRIKIKNFLKAYEWKDMMNNKKSEAGIGSGGYQTVVIWAVIIAIGLILFFIARSSGDTGASAWETLKKIMPFF
tara:strand:+ start:2271 stop:2504 length:234 start_codon:yes stop_codon:yes gene_type:complete